LFIFSSLLSFSGLLSFFSFSHSSKRRGAMVAWLRIDGERGTAGLFNGDGAVEGTAASWAATGSQQGSSGDGKVVLRRRWLQEE
jgi:hypothetical protein